MARPKSTFAEQLENLEVGHSIALAHRLAFDEFFDIDEIDKWFEVNRALIGSYLHRLRKETDTAELVNESGTTFNADRSAVIAFIVITRVG